MFVGSYSVPGTALRAMDNSINATKNPSFVLVEHFRIGGGCKQISGCQLWWRQEGLWRMKQGRGIVIQMRWYFGWGGLPGTLSNCQIIGHIIVCSWSLDHLSFNRYWVFTFYSFEFQEHGECFILARLDSFFFLWQLHIDTFFYEASTFQCLMLVH